MRPSAAQRPILTAKDISRRRRTNDMTDAGIAGQHAQGSPTVQPAGLTTERTAWAGWVFFAGIMMIMLGAFQIIEGIVALFNRSYYLVGSTGLVVSVDYAAWGWTHLLIGILVLAVGFGVLSGRTWARVVGIVLAGVSAVVNLAFIAAYPLWATIIITVDVIVIYALAVHGRELEV
jgi:hypothetical protein